MTVTDPGKTKFRNIDFRYSRRICAVSKGRPGGGRYGSGLIMVYTRRGGWKTSVYLATAAEIALAREFVELGEAIGTRPGPGALAVHLDAEALAYLGISRYDGRITATRAFSESLRVQREYDLLDPMYRDLMNAEDYARFRRRCQALRQAANRRGESFCELTWWHDTMDALRKGERHDP
jgi:hypothetical protein